jgi:hypothetical protein
MILLTDLPAELLDQILGLVSLRLRRVYHVVTVTDNLQISDIADLYSFCQTSKQCYAHAFPQICAREPVVVWSDGAGFGESRALDFNLDQLTDVANDPLHLRRRTKALHFKARSWDQPDQRCFHLRELDAEVRTKLKLGSQSENNILDYWGGEYGRRLAASLEKLGNVMLKEFKYVAPVRQLYEYPEANNFRWEMGTCIPREILGECGWLSREQPNIESLTLITGAACHYNVFHTKSSSLSLKPFRKLRSLAWIGILTDKEEEEVRMALAQNSRHIERIALDFTQVRANDLHERLETYNAIVTLGLGLRRTVPERRKLIYEKLKSLSLCNATITHHRRHWAHPMINEINWPNMTHLSLVNCPGGRDLVKKLGDEIGSNLQLKTFEYRSEVMEANRSEAHALEVLLESFTGLEGLYLHLESELDDEDSQEVWRAASRHRSTLQRFAYQVNRWHDNGNYEYHEDVFTLGLTNKGDLECVSQGNVLNRLERLRCLGLAARVDVWVRYFTIGSRRSRNLTDVLSREQYWKASWTRRTRPTFRFCTCEHP